MRRISLSYREGTKVRITALVIGIGLHLFFFGVLLFLHYAAPETMKLGDLDFRSSGGGGGGNLKLYEVEFGPQSGTQTTTPEEKEKINIKEVKPADHLADVGTPVIKAVKKKKKTRQSEDRLFGENLPIKHHRGTGPGAGGGMGGGTGGGIGKSSGSGIDWGGTGSRRLLSGAIPAYPAGTNKEMPVYLQFTVLPDGSVSTVIPLRKSDELLERASIAALKTWRFDPLPPQADQKAQIGKITFNFKLE